MSTTPAWITMRAALAIEGSPSVEALADWIKRWNDKPETRNKILRRFGKVEKNSLVAAINEDASNFSDAGATVANALVEMATNPRTRRSSSKTSKKGASARDHR